MFKDCKITRLMYHLDQHHLNYKIYHGENCRVCINDKQYLFITTTGSSLGYVTYIGPDRKTRTCIRKWQNPDDLCNYISHQLCEE